MHDNDNDTAAGRRTSTAPPALATRDDTDDTDDDGATAAALRQRIRHVQVHLACARAAALESQVHYHEALWALQELRLEYAAAQEATGVEPQHN